MIEKNTLLPRERLINFGPESLSNTELFALFLRTGTKKNSVFALSEKLLRKYNLNELSRKSYYELLEFNGISNVKACLIVALFELSRRIASLQNNPSLKQIKNSKDIFHFIRQDFFGLKIEKVMLILLNSKNYIIRKEIISEGSINFAFLDFHKILKLILSYNALNFILIHNHPTNCLDPSSKDIENTLKLKKFCSMINITLLDHIIVGNEGYYSFLDNDLFNDA